MLLCLILCYWRTLFSFFCFFFQAEDGIRDIGVTGVQTCALPILKLSTHPFSHGLPGAMVAVLAPTAVIQSRTASATNSGPLPERMCPGTPRRMNRSGRKSVVEGKSVDLGGRRIIKKKNRVD